MKKIRKNGSYDFTGVFYDSRIRVPWRGSGLGVISKRFQYRCSKFLGYELGRFEKNSRSRVENLAKIKKSFLIYTKNIYTHLLYENVHSKYFPWYFAHFQRILLIKFMLLQTYFIKNVWNYVSVEGITYI